MYFFFGLALTVSSIRTGADQGKMVRFWATPEKTAFWEELYSAGVDLIKPAPCDELSPCAIENNVARHGQFNLLAINPAGRRR